MNGFILDILLIVLIIIFALIGFYKGFLRELVSLGSFFGSLVITYFAYKPFGELLNLLFGWGTKIADFIMLQVVDIAPVFGTETAGSVEDLQQIIDNSNGVGIGYTAVLKELVKKADIPAGETVTVAQAIGNIVSGLAMAVISCIVLFIVLKIVVFLLDKIFKAIPKKSAVGVANKWLGLITGTAKGVLSLSMLIIFVYFLCLIPAVNDFVHPYVESSFAFKHIYNYLGNFVLGTI